MANKTMSAHGDLEFIKIYMDEMDSHALKIPVAFLKRLLEYPRIFSKLEGPSGTSWEVAVDKIKSDVYFTEGWADFVKGNNLESRDFLTFSYDGNSTFKVKIYGADGCIKRSKPLKKMKIFKQEIPEENLITPFQVNIPASSRSGCLLNIPAKFGNRFMKMGENFETTLRTCRGNWSVRLCSGGERLRFRKGWIKFYRDNDLCVGDTCHFKLIDEEKFIFQVCIEKNDLKEETIEVIVL